MNCSSKQSLLLIPGMMCDGALFQPQVDALSDAFSIDVVSIPNKPTISAMAAQILEQAPSRFAVAGLSMGGIIAIEMYRQAPQRISHIALIDSNARADLPERASVRLGQIKRAKAGQLLDIIGSEMMPHYFSPSHQDTEAMKAVVLSMAEREGVEAFEMQSLALKDRLDNTSVLSTINVPALFLCGQDDVLCDVVTHEAMSRAVSGSKLVVIEGCGHISTLEAPTVVNESLRDWLEQ